MSDIPRFADHFGTNFAEPLHSEVPAYLQPNNHKLPQPFVVLITGASRGIGAGTALAFAKAGATGLIITARTIAALDETKKACLAASPLNNGLQITTIAAEAGSEEDTRRIVQEVTTEHGRLDVLINNVGVVSTNASGWGNFDGIDSEQVLVPMRVNYYGRFLMMQALLPLLLASKEGGGGTIITITSECSHFTTFGPMGFNISELASNRLVETVAAKYADKNLVAFSVHPGMVATTTPPGAPDGLHGHASDSPDLCGAFCVWLVRERPQWLSGRYLSAKWDVEELVKKKEEILEGDKLTFKMVV
jgi:NAD(P)-dependent dehydrogenase (short-subunit alcohol dehydrogenase family)